MIASIIIQVLGQIYFSGECKMSHIATLAKGNSIKLVPATLLSAVAVLRGELLNINDHILIVNINQDLDNNFTTIPNWYIAYLPL